MGLTRTDQFGIRPGKRGTNPLRLGICTFGSVCALIVCFAAMSEFAGMAGAMLSGPRRLEGPLGKADRSIVLALVGIAIAARGRLPEGVWAIVPALCLGLVITIWNRLRFAMAEWGSAAE